MKPLELEFLNGPRAGEKIYLTEGRLRFGRSASNEISFSWDRMVSSQHCQIVYENDHYLLVDLESTNGTLVNSAPIRRWQLANADRITIGKTLLHVVLATKPLEESHNELPAISGDASNEKQVYPPSTSTGTSEPRKAFHNPLDSGVFTSALASRFEGESSTPPIPADLDQRASSSLSMVGSTLRAAVVPNQVVEIPDADPQPLEKPRELQAVQAIEHPCHPPLAWFKGNWPDFSDDAFWLSLFQRETEKTYAIVDLGKAGETVSKLLKEQAVPILDPPGAASARLPALVPVFETEDWAEWVFELWDCNAIVLMQSALSLEELLELLRNVTSRSEKSHESGRGVLGVFWPGVLSAMLRANYEPVIQKLFPSLTFVLMEQEESPETWQLFSENSQLPSLFQPWLKIQKTDKSH